MSPEHFDVVIIGAGLSGIDAAWHVQKKCPQKSYVILETRSNIGGTWDLFRYPGIRCDTDMMTMSYPFRPWKSAKMMATGDEIRGYVTETATENGITKNIRFQHKVISANWDTKTARWHIVAERGSPHAERVTLTANFLFSAAGYYRYEAGYAPDFKGRERFKGVIVHPQHWPENLNYAGKRVVIIGSGATAVTLVPAMAKTAGHVIMLQRSPSYIFSLPEIDTVAKFLRRVLPEKIAFKLARWKNAIRQQLIFRASMKNPEKTRKHLLEQTQMHLGKDYDISKHFTPNYMPWEQRLCLVPDADLFIAIRERRASVVTDHIETFTENGIKLKSGEEIQADIIVTATGLVLEFLGGIKVAVDGRPVDFSQCWTYKGVMYSDVPNLISVFGYINASYTLRANLICEYLTRLLNHMDKKSMRQVTPRVHDRTMKKLPYFDNFTSGYVQRSIASWPKQGTHAPWTVKQSLFADIKTLKRDPIGDNELEFSNPPPALNAKVPQAAE